MIEVELANNATAYVSVFHIIRVERVRDRSLLILTNQDRIEVLEKAEVLSDMISNTMRHMYRG